MRRSLRKRPVLAPTAAATGEQARRDLLDALDHPAWLIDGTRFTLSHANAAAQAWLGESLAQLLGQRAETLLPTLEDLAFWIDARDGLASPLNSQTEVPGPDGQPAAVQRRIAPLPTAHPQRPDWLLTLRDLRREREAERESERLLGELRATLEAAADGILVTDLHGGVRAFNRRFAALWQLPESALAERNDAALLAWLALNTSQPEAFRRQFAEVSEQLLSSATWSVRLVDGSTLVCRTEPQWRGGQPVGRVHSFKASVHARGAQAAREPAAIDAWTRLPDRDAFLLRVEAATAQARQHGASLSLLCIELDRQALYGLGHVPGMQARSLSEVTEALRAGLGGRHLLGRIGSVRFGLLLEQSSEAAAEAVARRWLAMADTHGPGPQPLAGLAPVVGIAAYPHAGLQAEELLASAEAALLQARLVGEPCQIHRYASGGDSQRQERLTLALREGLAQPQFHLHYQPRVDPASGQVQALEALVRWRDPVQGELLPAQFLPLVERAGLGSTLDDWVLEQALRQAVRWREQGTDLPVTVNVGASQLGRPGLARRVAAALAHTGWPAQRLEIDLTEAALRQDPDSTLVAVRALRDLGVRVVLDDFGSGDASLALLRRYPLSAVKLDRTLMRGLPRPGSDHALVDGLISLAHALHLPILVEGVENEAQRDFVQSRGCEGWQGFLHAPALDARRLTQYLAAQARGLSRVR